MKLKMTDQKNDFVKVACPNCSEKFFSFTRNILNEKNKLIFICPSCKYSVEFTINSKGDIWIMSYL